MQQLLQQRSLLRLSLTSAACTALMATLTTEVAAAQDLLVVGPGGTYATIQSAVNAAAPGDVVEIQSGTYAEDVVVADKGLTLVCADTLAAAIDGTLRVVDLPRDEVFLAANLSVRAPDADVSGSLAPFAVHVESCEGPVRLQDLTVAGALGATNDTIPYNIAHPGGPGARVTDSGDVAITDCQIDGGAGGPWLTVPFDGGDGGAALESHGTTRILAQRCAFRGGAGATGESGGSGGIGAALFDASHMVVAYSAFIGAHGADAFNLEGGSGGDGIFVSAGALVDDFGGVYSGGYVGTSYMSVGGNPRDGFPMVGQGVVQPVPDGHPSAVSGPAAVRVGQTFDIGAVGIAGEAIQPLSGSRPAFRWFPVFRQPLMLAIDRGMSRALGNWQILGANGRTTYPQPAAALPAGQDARVIWYQAHVGGAASRLTSARALVILR